MLQVTEIVIKRKPSPGNILDAVLTALVCREEETNLLDPEDYNELVKLCGEVESDVTIEVRLYARRVPELKISVAPAQVYLHLSTV